MILGTLIAAAAMTLHPTFGYAQDSTSAALPEPTWKVQWMGLGYAAPNGWFLSWAAAEGYIHAIDGRALMLEVGMSGTRLGAGYAFWTEGYGAVARVTALRTYRQPQWVAPNRTLVGPEIRVAIVASLGVALLWDVGPRPRSGAPIIAYSISFIL